MSLRRHLAANAVAYVALFVALGGGSYAAVRAALPARSVGARQLKDRAVTLRKIHPKALLALKGQEGPRGDTGMRGPQGFRGPEGLRGANGADGQDGAPGTPASATLLQGRATQSPFTTSGSGADADLPLQSGTFQQPATGTVLLVAQATFTSPANWSSTACPNGTPGLTTNSATVDVLVDGVKSGSLTTNFSPTENSVAKTTVLDPRTIAVDAGSASARTVTVKARDGCADRDFQITGLRVNVYSLG